VVARFAGLLEKAAFQGGFVSEIGFPPSHPRLKKPASSAVALKADGSRAERRAVIMNLWIDRRKSLQVSINF
jgi:hypothetical protein